MMSNLTRIRHSRETRKPAKKNSSLFVKRVAQHCFCTHTHAYKINTLFHRSYSRFVLVSFFCFISIVRDMLRVNIMVVRGTAKDEKKQHT